LNILFKVLHYNDTVDLNLLIFLEILKSYNSNLYNKFLNLDKDNREDFFHLEFKDNDILLNFLNKHIYPKYDNDIGDNIYLRTNRVLFPDMIEIVIQKIEFLDKFNMASNQ